MAQRTNDASAAEAYMNLATIWAKIAEQALAQLDATNEEDAPATGVTGAAFGEREGSRT